jgi:hypothetical protein
MYLKHWKEVSANALEDRQLRLNVRLGGTYFERLHVFLLLLVNYTQPEIDFVCLLEIRCHAHDL